MNNKKNKIILGVIFTIAFVLLIGATTFAVLNFSEESGENSVSTGSIQLVYQEPESALSLNPTDVSTDADGKIQTSYFPFYVQGKATGTINLSYYIYLTTGNDNTLENSVVKVYLSKVNAESDAIEAETVVLAPTLVSDLVSFDPDTLTYSATSKNYLLHSNKYTFDNNDANQTHYYRLRLWLDENYTINNDISITNSTGTSGSSIHQATLNSKTFKMKVNVAGHNGDPVTIQKQ